MNGWLTTVFAPHRLRDTIDQMIAGQQATGDEAAAEAAAARIADANDLPRDWGRGMVA